MKKMNVHIKPGDLTQRKELDALANIMTNRVQEHEAFYVDLTHTKNMDLSLFNSLVVLYTRLRRAKAVIQYENYNEAVKKYVDKTNFHHVFAG
ncbi:MAG: hypothetical protein AAGA66_12045 [Bacteroidota bacterium]